MFTLGQKQARASRDEMKLRAWIALAIILKKRSLSELMVGQQMLALRVFFCFVLFCFKLCVCNSPASMVKYGGLREFMLGQTKLSLRAFFLKTLCVCHSLAIMVTCGGLSEFMLGPKSSRFARFC